MPHFHFVGVTQTHGKAAARGTGPFVNGGGGCHVLERHAGAVEYGYFLAVGSPGLSTGDNFAEFSVHIGLGHNARGQGVMQIAYRGALLQHIHNHFAGRHQAGVKLLFFRIVCANAGDKRARRNHALFQESAARSRARDAQVAVANGIGKVAHGLNLRGQLTYEGVRKLARLSSSLSKMYRPCSVNTSASARTCTCP